ncbi:NADP-dependent oxidoreductase domain-containing protein [Hyaloraphidium curvatum]|nr:NADP-dependent oxidoreductase domain-containing protein [Hyaloraphidium curvatum]
MLDINHTAETDASVPPMTYTRLGSTGLQVSRICLGHMSYGSSKWDNWVLEEDAALPLIKYAHDRGINFHDTANVYSNGQSEIILGNAIKKYQLDRDRLVIATKVYNSVFPETPGRRHFGQGFPKALEHTNRGGPGGLSRKAIMQEVEHSLKRLGTDYIDLYQIHRFDYDTPVEETMLALHDLVRSGKVRYLGASSMWAHQFQKMQFIAKMNGWTPFVSMQNLHNLIYRNEEREMVPVCEEWGVGMIPWSPLAGGLLGGLNRATLREKKNEFSGMLRLPDVGKTLDALQKVAEARGEKQATVALAWSLSKPFVASPIVGCSKTTYIDDACRATALKLTKEEIAALEKEYRPKPNVGFMDPINPGRARI